MIDVRQIERELAALFVAQLNVEVPTIHTDLFESGILDSLKLVELLVQVEQKFGVRVSLDDAELANFRTVAAIVQFIARRTG